MSGHPYRTPAVVPPRRAPWWARLLARAACVGGCGYSHALARWRWYRRALGGHWELRWGTQWHRFDRCQYETWPPLTPCEQWDERAAGDDAGRLLTAMAPDEAWRRWSAATDERALVMDDDGAARPRAGG